MGGVEGMAAGYMAAHVMATAGSKRFLLLYGSQTGQAKAIAEEICQQATTRGYSPDIHCISMSEKEFVLSEEPVVVIVVSTTGEGEPPDTVNRFWRKLKRKTVPVDLLKDVHYALLGLGDTNYTNFCNMGKMLNKRLQELSAVSFYETGYADDGVGLELVVEPWIEGLWGALEEYFNNTQPSSIKEEPDNTIVNLSKEVLNDTTTLPIKKELNIHTDTIVESNKAEPTSISSTTVEVPTENPISDITIKKSDATIVQSITQELGDTSTIHKLSQSLAEQMHIEGFTESEVLLRGSNDDFWLHQSITASPLPPAYLILELHENNKQISSEFLFTESVQGSTMTKSTVTMAAISNRRVLTSSEAQKVVLELEMSWKSSDDLRYQPGDALCFICPNDSIEVDYIIERLKLQSVKDDIISLSIDPKSHKKNPIIPKHIPKMCTVHQYLTHCADLRSFPKKALLSVLSEHCTSDFERKRLKWLASRQGSSDYMKLVIEKRVDLLDLLHCFTSCSPPLARLIELLPRLQPRYYSVTSSPLLTGENKTRIVFNIIELPSRSYWQDRKRQGLCTGWFNMMSLKDDHQTSCTIPIYPRLKNPFHLPPDPLVPIILIGPGTGVAPLIGFLEHRKALKTVTGIDVGPSWLFFGCRHFDHDFLYKSEIEEFLAAGILTSFDVSFSRLPDDMYLKDGHVKYVQDLMARKWNILGEWIMEKGAAIYVCGDAEKMVSSIKEAMTKLLQQYSENKGINSDGKSVLQDLVDNGRFIVDLWI